MDVKMRSCSVVLGIRALAVLVAMALLLPIIPMQSAQGAVFLSVQGDEGRDFIRPGETVTISMDGAGPDSGTITMPDGKEEALDFTINTAFFQAPEMEGRYSIEVQYSGGTVTSSFWVEAWALYAVPETETVLAKTQVNISISLLDWKGDSYPEQKNCIWNTSLGESGTFSIQGNYILQFTAPNSSSQEYITVSCLVPELQISVDCTINVLPFWFYVDLPNPIHYTYGYVLAGPFYKGDTLDGIVYTYNSTVSSIIVEDLVKGTSTSMEPKDNFSYPITSTSLFLITVEAEKENMTSVFKAFVFVNDRTFHHLEFMDFLPGEDITLTEPDAPQGFNVATFLFQPSLHAGLLVDGDIEAVKSSELYAEATAHEDGATLTIPTYPNVLRSGYFQITMLTSLEGSDVRYHATDINALSISRPLFKDTAPARENLTMGLYLWGRPISGNLTLENDTYQVTAKNSYGEVQLPAMATGNYSAVFTMGQDDYSPMNLRVLKAMKVNRSILMPSHTKFYLVVKDKDNNIIDVEFETYPEVNLSKPFPGSRSYSLFISKKWYHNETVGLYVISTINFTVDGADGKYNITAVEPYAGFNVPDLRVLINDQPYRTDKNGTIFLETDAMDLELEAYIQGQIVGEAFVQVRDEELGGYETLWALAITLVVILIIVLVIYITWWLVREN